MILKVEKFQEACKKILGAVDTDSAIKGVIYGYDTLELNASNNKLQLNVSNGEYYASVSLDYAVEEGFRAVIDAKVFLTLISKLTTEDVELTLDEKSVNLSILFSPKIANKLVSASNSASHFPGGSSCA